MEQPPTGGSSSTEGGSASPSCSEDEDAFLPESLAANQLKALLWKNCKVKQRNVCSTFCELCSPCLLIAVLVWGFSLSTITVIAAENYAVVNRTIPGPFLRSALGLPLADTASGISSPSTQLFDLLKGPLPVPTLDQYVTLSGLATSAIGDLRFSPLLNSDEGQSLNNLLFLGSLHFAPDSAATQSLVSYLSATSLSFANLTTSTHPDEASAVQTMLAQEERAWALIVLHSVEPGNVDFTLRLNYSAIPSTYDLVDWMAVGLDTEYQDYYLSGFLTLQAAVNEWAFNYTSTGPGGVGVGLSDNRCTDGPPRVLSAPMPTPPFAQNTFFSAVGYLLGLAMTMATLYPVSKLLKDIVEEKETRMKETLKIMGAKGWVLQLSWLLNALSTFVPLALGLTWLMGNSFLPASAPSLLFAYLMLFFLSEIAFVFLLSTIFSRAKLAAIVGPVALFVTVLPRYVFFNTANNEASVAKYAASLLSATAFTFGADVLAGYEYANVGVQWSNYEGRDARAYSFASCLRMMLLDTLLYFLLACYLDKVVPSEYGTHETPWFFLLPSYWRLSPPSPSSPGPSDNVEDGQAEADSVEGPPDVSIHPRRVAVRGLVKRYGDGNMAVKGLQLDMFEGHVTCLLGHNGAGKTSAISLLTGLFPPTSGDATIWGHSLTKDLPRIRQSLGICPQLNVLFPEMTVAEHLTFFSLLKGMPKKRRAQRVETMIHEVGLWEKRHTYSRALSGGMKRKLCIANALVASPNFILLDEPTSGMDPFSRRATWELIQRSKRKRVVVLTTHYLDEAELLGDRIAIMSAGRLKTCGTPLFLKHRYGSGYSLTLVTGSPSSSPPSTSSLSSLVHTYAPDAELFSEAGAELLFRLPLSCSAVFPSLLRALGGEEGRSLGIQSFGISMTTLEEVFLKIAKDEQRRLQQPQAQPSNELLSLTPHQALDVADPLDQTNRTTFPLDASAHSPLHGTLRGRDNTRKPFPTAAGSAQVCDMELPTTHQSPLDTPPSPSNAPPSRSFTLCASLFSRPWALEALRLWEQLRQLLWKRAIVARRDVKGLCFQVLLPAVVIALVLLILTIKPRMAGPSIPLDLGLYAPYGGSETFYSSADANASSPTFSLLSSQDTSRTSYRYMDSGGSYNTSELLLQRYYDHGSDARLGALVFGDQVLLNLTIDFPALQGSLPAVEETVLSVAEASVFEGLTSPAPGIIAYEGPVTIPFSTQDASAQTLLTSAVQAINSNANASVTSPEAVGNFVDGLLQTLNLTDSEVLQALNVSLPANVTLTDLLVQLLDGANSTSINGTFLSTPLTGSLLAQRLLFNITSDELTLENTELQTNTGGSVMLGNVTYVLDDTSLPDEALLFQLYLSSPYTVLHNTSSPHAVAAYYGELVRLEYGRCSGQPSPHFVTRSHPLPLSESETLNVQTVLSLFTALFLLIPLTYIPAAFVVFVVRERAVKSKHLQFVSGVNRQMYWVSTFVWDMLQYAVLCCLIMGVFFLYGGGATRTYLYNAETTLATFLLLWFYGLAAIVQAYLYSWGFENAATAQISIMGINFLTGFVFVMAYYIMLSIPKTEAAAIEAVKFFRLFPSYNIGDGLINLSTMYYMNYWFGAELSAFDWDCTGRPLAYLVAQLAVFSFLVLAVDSDVCERCLEVLGRAQDRVLLGRSEAQGEEGQEEDEDVAEERQRVMAAKGDDSEHAVLLQGLRKTYRQAKLSQCFARGGQGTEGAGGRAYKRAVRGVTLAIPHAQCFGFLGINGAGKTTTLSIVTGDLRETAGVCYVNGHPARSAEARRSIGYCPQVDPLTDFMTGIETLLFYGSLKGLPKDQIPHAAQSLIQRVGLQKFAHKPCGSYSGGNKRKLSLAIALIGDPPVVLLDEPSCGMDPEARRQMWDVITACSKHQSIILTTHSMEECEALCSRVSIMVGGRLRCLGSCQHLKNRFGRGYKVEVRCTGMEHLPTLACALTDRFGPGVREEEAHGLLVRYSLLPAVPPLPTDLLSPRSHAMQSQEWLADLFALLEAAKERGQVDEYCVSQTTLEQVFVQFAKAQEDEEDGVVQVDAGPTEPERSPAQLASMTGPSEALV